MAETSFSSRVRIHLLPALQDDCFKAFFEELGWDNIHVLHILDQVAYVFLLLLSVKVFEHPLNLFVLVVL